MLHCYNSEGYDGIKLNKLIRKFKKDNLYTIVSGKAIKRIISKDHIGLRKSC